MLLSQLCPAVPALPAARHPRQQYRPLPALSSPQLHHPHYFCQVHLAHVAGIFFSCTRPAITAVLGSPRARADPSSLLSWQLLLPPPPILGMAAIVGPQNWSCDFPASSAPHNANQGPSSSGPTSLISGLSVIILAQSRPSVYIMLLWGSDP